MDKIKLRVESRHRLVRENSLELWKKASGRRGFFLIKCATIEEFNQRSDFENPPFVVCNDAQYPNLHQSINEYLNVYSIDEGFIYVICIDKLPDGAGLKSILSPQLVHKEAWNIK
jgi:hypothetical protein